MGGRIAPRQIVGLDSSCQAADTAYSVPTLYLYAQLLPGCEARRSAIMQLLGSEDTMASIKKLTVKVKIVIELYAMKLCTRIVSK